MGEGEHHIADAAARAKILASQIERWGVGSRLSREHDALARMGIDIRVWRRAVCARPVSADAHLAICHELGIDPVRCGEPRPSLPLAGPIQWAVLGAAVRIARDLRGHNVREAGKACGVSCATISRAENGMALSFEALARCAAYAGRHPHFYTHTSRPGEAPRSTGNTDCNTLNRQGVNAP